MMETLAVVAYRQPVSRANAEAVRGVACGELLRQLMERDLIRIAGRGEELGRPYLYGTTQLFGLPSVDALPPIQWQTLQDDPDQDTDVPENTLDSPTEDLSTSPKESVVSTAVAPVLSPADPEVLSLHGTLVPESDAPADQQPDPSAVDDDEDEWDDEVDDDDDDIDDDDDLDDDWDDDDEDDDDDEIDDEEELDDLEEDDDEWQEVDDEDEDDDDDDDDWDDDDEEDDWDEEEDDDDQEWD
jgi:segregation and condensation protein B